MAAAKLDVEGVTAGYGSTEIVSGISFSVSAGERLAIFGRNGVGKTTLLATLMGLTSLHRGRILLNGADLAGCRTSLRAERGLGYVPQTRGIFGSLTVEENLLTGLKGRPRADIAEAYAMFPRLAERRSILACACPGASSRCSRSRARCSGRRRSCCSTSLLRAWPPSSATRSWSG